MRLPFGRRPSRLKELNDQITRLREEIAALEASRAASQEESEVGAVYRQVALLRGNMAEQELAAKREELDALVAEATKLEALAPRPKPQAARPEPESPQPAPRVARPAGRLRPLLVAGSAVVLLAVAAAGALVLLSPGDVLVSLLRPAGGATPTVQVAPSTVEIAPLIVTRLATRQGETFFTRDLELSYAGGSVLLSGQPSPEGEFFVDDAMAITVVRPDGTSASWSRTFNADCLENAPLGPQDVTDLFRPGLNKVSVVLRDVCGSTVGTLGPIFLSYRQG
jgi:hypothetical protein